jgi:hypothetical protein
MVCEAEAGGLPSERANDEDRSLRIEVGYRSTSRLRICSVRDDETGLGAGSYDSPVSFWTEIAGHRIFTVEHGLYDAALVVRKLPEYGIDAPREQRYDGYYRQNRLNRRDPVDQSAGDLWLELSFSRQVDPKSVGDVDRTRPYRGPTESQCRLVRIESINIKIIFRKTIFCRSGTCRRATLKSPSVASH